MRRLILAAALWPLMAHAADCPATLTDCGTINANNGNFGGQVRAPGITWLAAVDFGVKADAVLDPLTGAFVSGTPDDVALKAAIDACSAANTELILPPRPMLVDGTGPVARIENCKIRGVARHGGTYAAAKGGTMIVLRGDAHLAHPAFHIRKDWTLDNVAFYHPDQVGVGAKFTGIVSGTSLTVSGTTSIGGGGIQAGYLLAGNGVPLQTVIQGQVSGTPGGDGVYTVSRSFSAPSGVMSVVRPPIQYKAILADDGTVGAGHFVMNDVTFINPYDGIDGTAGVGWGAFQITGFHGWALHDLFAFGYIGDTPRIGMTIGSPGPWFDMTGAIDATKLMLNWGGQNNAMFHLKGTGTPLPWQIATEGVGGQSFRYLFKVDGGGVSFTQSVITVVGDAFGTVLSVPEGSSYAGFNTVIRGSAGCNVVDWMTPGGQMGPVNCFEISSTSSLVLEGFTGYSMGNVVQTNGGDVTIRGGQFSAGGMKDGNDYAVVKQTADVAQIKISGTSVAGVACFQSALGCQHVRGIDGNGFGTTFLQVQDSVFSYFKNAIRARPTQFGVLTGDSSFSTEPTSVSVLLSGTAPITWEGNTFDIAPRAALVSCGGSGATINGTLRGYIVVGSTSTNSCSLDVPFSPPLLVFQAWAADGTPLAVNSPNTTRLNILGVALADIAGKTIFYDWRGSK